MSLSLNFSLLVAETLFSKALSIAGQFVLASLLLPEHFGLLVATTMARAVGEIVSEPGLKIFLIQKGKAFNELAGTAFLLSIVLGTLTGVAIIAAYWMMRPSTNSAELNAMFLIVACSIPLRSLSIVPDAALRINQRFGILAWLGILATVLTQGLSIVLALAGCGAVSLVAPLLVTAVVHFALTYSITRPPLRMHAFGSHLYDILVHVSALLASRITTVVSANIDYAFLMLFHSKETLGIYYLAFTLSTQTIRLFSQNLVHVLMPSLALQENVEKRIQTTIRASRLIALTVIPLSCFQVLLTPPAVKTLFKPAYEDMVPIAQILTIGIAFRCITAVYNSLLNASGRFHQVLRFDILSTCLLSITVLLAAYYGSAVSVAVVVALNVVLRMYIMQYAALNTFNARHRTGIGVIFVPCAIAAIAAIPSLTIGFAARLFNLDSTPVDLAAAMTYPIFAYYVARALAADDVRQLTNLLASLIARLPIFTRHTTFAKHDTP